MCLCDHFSDPFFSSSHFQIQSPSSSNLYRHNRLRFPLEKSALGGMPWGTEGKPEIPELYFLGGKNPTRTGFLYFSGINTSCKQSKCIHLVVQFCTFGPLVFKAWLRGHKWRRGTAISLVSRAGRQAWLLSFGWSRWAGVHCGRRAGETDWEEIDVIDHGWACSRGYALLYSILGVGVQGFHVKHNLAISWNHLKSFHLSLLI